MDQFDLQWMGIKIAAVVVILLHIVPIMVWVERRGSAFMQNRSGPNRVGPLGLLQSLADVIKFIFKEDVVPGHVEKFFYLLAPCVLLIPAFMLFAVIPFGGEITIGERVLSMQISDLDVGILYIFSIASLGVYGIIMASWASNNKYSMLGGLRSTSQMISYELSLGLGAIGMMMIAGSVNLREIVHVQNDLLFGFLPAWGVFTQPLGFWIFLVSSYAETNRLPFDLPEGESEIVAGYHTEYGSMKFALFFMAEYLNMLTSAALVTTLFFGGYLLIPGMGHLLAPLAGLLTKFFAVSDAQGWALIFLQIISFSTKVGFFMWMFVWVRWTLPRFRYDQLMDFGWKILLPLSLANVVITAFLIYFGVL